MFGYMGKLLRVDLGKRKIEEEFVDEGVLRSYIGGSGLGTKFLYEETSQDTDPLGEDNLLIFMTGPLGGSRIPTSGRHSLVYKSPLTGIYAENNVGGSWGVGLKNAGYDGIIFKGASEKPVYLWVSDEKVELRDAIHLWGKDTYEVDELMKNETSRGATTALIGKAGENKVRMAAITHNGKHSRMAGRCGAGAVMGSKNLKGVAVDGKLKPEIYAPEKLSEYNKNLLEHIMKVTEKFGKYGTSGGIEGYEKLGNFPHKNWVMADWPEGAKKISGIAMHDTILTGRTACRHCPIACGRRVKVLEGKFAPVDGEGPEYETIGVMGGLCLIDNLEAIAMANELCNRFGLDTISVGSTVAFAMEAYEKRIISKEDSDGIEIVWGNAEALVEITKLIAEKRGIGELLGNGIKYASEKLGKETAEFAVHVKGLEFPAHDPRCFWSQALSFSTSNRGACHLAGWSHPYETALYMTELGINEPHEKNKLEGKADVVVKLQNMMSVMDSLILCKFIQIGKAATVTNILNWIKMTTGWDMDVNEFIKTGERLFNLKRMFNMRLGINKKDDKLPPRIMTIQRKGENYEDHIPPMDKLLDDYYAIRGWDENGVPTQGKLNELDL